MVVVVVVVSGRATMRVGRVPMGVSWRAVAWRSVLVANRAPLARRPVLAPVGLASHAAVVWYDASDREVAAVALAWRVRDPLAHRPVLAGGQGASPAAVARCNARSHLEVAVRALNGTRHFFFFYFFFRQ